MSAGNISQLRKITPCHKQTLPSITFLVDFELRLLLSVVTLNLDAKISQYAMASETIVLFPCKN